MTLRWHCDGPGCNATRGVESTGWHVVYERVPHGLPEAGRLIRARAGGVDYCRKCKHAAPKGDAE